MISPNFEASIKASQEASYISVGFDPKTCAKGNYVQKSFIKTYGDFYQIYSGINLSKKKWSHGSIIMDKSYLKQLKNYLGICFT